MVKLDSDSATVTYSNSVSGDVAEEVENVLAEKDVSELLEDEYLEYVDEETITATSIDIRSGREATYACALNCSNVTVGTLEQNGTPVTLKTGETVLFYID